MLLLGMLTGAQATNGVDLSTLTSQYSCFKSNGQSFAIIRGYCSYGAVDPNINTNIKNSNAAGLITDIYMFPCRGKSAADQVNQLVSAVGQPEGPAVRTVFDEEQKGLRAGVGQRPGREIHFEGSAEVNLTEYRDKDGAYGMVWIDVETNPSSGCSWSGHSAADNCAYLGQLISALETKGKKVGIYASAYMWETIMGSRSACPNYNRIPVWYAHYDGSASFSDWPTVSFGGWSKPSIKQFSGDKVLCSTGVDFNFY
jgi:GH25 family lysozyme M1 (1,4-beta-N-acetylmuramidase)